jgi:sugar/nucleoside kinase (ribokinase family)
MSDIDVLCIGQVVADVVAQPFSSFNLQHGAVGVDSIEVTNGGDASNASVNLTKLGNRVALVGRVGADDLGKMVLDRIKENGVAVNGIHVSETDRTSTCIVLIHEDGEHFFIYTPAANNSLCSDDVDRRLIERAKIVHFGAVFSLPGLEGPGMVEILRYAKELGHTTSMDLSGSAETMSLDKVEQVFPNLDYLLPSIIEAEGLAKTPDPEKAAAIFLSAGVSNVVIKLGGDGCYMANREESGYVAAFSVDKVVDTTGAGDAFVSGFLSGVVRGRTFRDCVRLGNAVGALAVRKAGATAGVTCMEDALALLKQSDEGWHDQP